MYGRSGQLMGTKAKAPAVAVSLQMSTLTCTCGMPTVMKTPNVATAQSPRLEDAAFRPT